MLVWNLHLEETPEFVFKSQVVSSDLWLSWSSSHLLFSPPHSLHSIRIWLLAALIAVKFCCGIRASSINRFSRARSPPAAIPTRFMRSPSLARPRLIPLWASVQTVSCVLGKWICLRILWSAAHSRVFYVFLGIFGAKSSHSLSRHFINPFHRYFFIFIREERRYGHSHVLWFPTQWERHILGGQWGGAHLSGQSIRSCRKVLIHVNEPLIVLI